MMEKLNIIPLNIWFTYSGSLCGGQMLNFYSQSSKEKRGDWT